MSLYFIDHITIFKILSTVFGYFGDLTIGCKLSFLWTYQLEEVLLKPIKSNQIKSQVEDQNPDEIGNDCLIRM
jgi:hypothetical protein